MEENEKPEIRVIMEALADHEDTFPSRIDKAEYIWDELITYWNNRGKNIVDDTKTEIADMIYSGSQVFDGQPYIHEGSVRTYDFPSSKSELDEFDDGGMQEATKDILIRELNEVVAQYEQCIENRLYIIREDLYEIAGLPYLSEKKKKKLTKIVNKLEEMAD